MDYRTYIMASVAVLGWTCTFAEPLTSTSITPFPNKAPIAASQPEEEKQPTFDVAETSSSTSTPPAKPVFQDVGGNLQMVTPGSTTAGQSKPANLPTGTTLPGAPPGTTLLPQGTQGYPNGAVVIPTPQPLTTVPQTRPTVPQVMPGVPQTNATIPHSQGVAPAAASPNITPGTAPGGQISQ